MSIFIDPCYKPAPAAPRAPRPPTLPSPSLPPPGDWCDLAFARDWIGAIMEYLRSQNGQPALTWSVINAVAAEARPQTRSELRDLRKQIWRSLRAAIRAKNVTRWRRTFLALPSPSFRAPSGASRIV